MTKLGRVTKKEIRMELETALKMTTIEVSYDVFVKLIKALNKLIDVPDDRYSIQKFWARCKQI